MALLTVITGAGASTAMGRDGQTVHMMTGWARALCDALDRVEPHLADVLGLRDVDGPSFEAAVGRFLAWEQQLKTNAGLFDLGIEGRTQNDAQASAWERQARSRAETIVRALRDTVYSLYGDTIGPYAVMLAWRSLLSTLGWREEDGLAIATTNYDWGLETGLAELGLTVDAGDVAGANCRKLRPRGLHSRVEHGVVPVLHLHGAVGWFNDPEGTVFVRPPTQSYNEPQGTQELPTILWPDPDKEPLTMQVIRDLWAELDTLLQRTSHLLFVGHSLHDPVLLRHVNEEVPTDAQIMVTAFAEDGLSVPPDEEDRIKSLLPRARVAAINFGPNIGVLHPGFKSWLR